MNVKKLTITNKNDGCNKIHCKMLRPTNHKNIFFFLVDLSCTIMKVLAL